MILFFIKRSIAAFIAPSIPQLADISSLTNDLLDCDTLLPDQRDIVNLIQKGVLELWQSLSK